MEDKRVKLSDAVKELNDNQKAHKRSRMLSEEVLRGEWHLH